MKLNLIAIGKKMPNWVNAAFEEYASRLPKDFSLKLIEITAQKRTKAANTQKIMAQESQSLLNAVPINNQLIALDRVGEALSTKEFANKLQRFYESSQDISLLIGGPEGISQTVLEKCNERWSFSKLTLPHPMVRVITAEQIFRAWSLLTNHPYHR